MFIRERRKLHVCYKTAVNFSSGSVLARSLTSYRTLFLSFSFNPQARLIDCRDKEEAELKVGDLLKSFFRMTIPKQSQYIFCLEGSSFENPSIASVFFFSFLFF